MENSKAQQKIIDLGRIIVSELEQDPGVDTLAKWMAHYVAEKIELAERLSGKERKIAQKECFETILKLWEHRWSASRKNSFLRDFEPLFETLEKLNPNREATFFIPPRIQFDFLEELEENDKENINEAKSQFDSALMVDRLARSLICELLNRAISGIDLNGDRGNVIRNAINMIDYPDLKIIRIALGYNKSLKTHDNDGHDKKKKRIDKLDKKIKDLEEFTSLRDYLLDSYKKELSEIERINDSKNVD